MPKTKEKKGFNEADLNEADKTAWKDFRKRRTNLIEFRKDHYGTDLDKLWAEADKAYVPHRLNSKRGKKATIEQDETKGWRGNMVELGSSNWQSDISQSNPFIKVQTALSILVDQNPSGVFTPASKKFQANNDLMKQLYERSWEYAKSKSQLRLFIFNLAKYGWATGRTYPLKLTQTVKSIKEWNEDDPEKTTYEEKEVTEYNDIFRENLDPRNVWIDDQAKPNNQRSVRDWVWRKVYDVDEFKKEFKGWSRAEFVTAGGNTQDTVNTTTKNPSKSENNTNLVEVFFYESKQKDQFIVEANGIPVIIAPLPIQDNKGVKKLSLWQTYWNLRHTESPYGIGIYESIRYDQAFLDRIRNMTIDQITLSIYKMFFYTGTNALSDTGEVLVRPGVGKQVLDPKNVNWLETPGPGQDAYLGMQMFRKDLDEASGITDPLIGVVTGKTAFEIAQAKESALKRLRNPLDNILDALNEEGYITVSLIQLTYSIPETYKVSDKNLIDAYLNEIQSDPDLYEREQDQIDEQTGETISGKFTAKVYPEFPLNLDKDEKGNLIETKESQFFRVKPELLTWEGVINIKSQSLLTPSKQVDKALDLEMFNMLIPLLQGMAQERVMLQQLGKPVDIDNLTTGKTAKEIIKLYDKDPKDIFPDAWFEEQAPPLFLSIGQPQMGMGQAPAEAPQAPTMIPSTQPPANPTSLAGNIANSATNPARAI